MVSGNEESGLPPVVPPSLALLQLCSPKSILATIRTKAMVQRKFKERRIGLIMTLDLLLILVFLLFRKRYEGHFNVVNLVAQWQSCDRSSGVRLRPLRQLPGRLNLKIHCGIR